MKKIIYPLAIAATVLALSGCSNNEDGENEMINGPRVNNGKYSDISADSVHIMLSSYTKIFDVSPYYQAGHLPYSKDVGGVAGLTAIAPSLDTAGMYLVYCHADEPSMAGAQVLVDAGLRHVYRLRGNYAAWDAGFYVDIAPAEAKRKIDAGEFMAVYDVSPHHADGHLPGAIDAYNKLAMLITDDDKSKSYLVYCHADAPSMAGAQTMEDAGFSKTFRLEGNFGAWKDAGYQVEK